MDAGSPSWLVQLLHTVAALSVGVGLLYTVRRIWRVSPLAGRIVATGFVLKVVVAGLLFWISYSRLPVLQGQHIGGGFWLFADDARGYYTDAAKAAALGLDTIDWRAPAPGYVRSLAVAITLFGNTPPVAVILNLVAYAATCALLTALLLNASRDADRSAGLIALTAVTFSPALFLWGTQPLKEELFCTFLVLAMAGAFLLFQELGKRAGRPWQRLVIGIGALWVGTYVIGGIRPYYPLFIWAATAGTLGLLLAAQRLRGLPAFVATGFTVLALLWGAFILGSGPEYYPYYTSRLWNVASRATTPGTDELSTSRVPSPARVAGSLMAELDGDRGTFIERGAGTNLVSDESAEGSVSAKLRTTGVGMLLLFLPASLLRGLSVVDFTGGRGLLLVSDLDTLFQDAIFIGVIVVLLKRRAAVRANLPFVVFASLLAASVALSLGYVVVNYGTLFRLRLLVALPLWMLTLAASDHPSSPGSAIVQPQEPVAARSGRMGNWMARATSTAWLSKPLLGESR